MDTLNSIEQNLRMVKSDTLSFNFQLQGIGDVEIDNILFTCKENPDNVDYIFQKYLGAGIDLINYDEDKDLYLYACRVSPQDTETADCGRYFYDLQANIGSDVFTLLRGRLSIEWEATSGEVPPPTPDYEDGDNIKY